MEKLGFWGFGGVFWGGFCMFFFTIPGLFRIVSPVTKHSNYTESMA